MSPSQPLMSVPFTNPEPAYIAASAASQIVTGGHQSQHRELEEKGHYLKNHTTVVSPASLHLVNAFLDWLLFNFLASARATSLASLRPAVTEVLKPRLAKEAIAGADEELKEYLGGEDDAELLALHNEQESSKEWDLDLVWKRIRLRCMVYTRLGDMEEDDEQMYIEQEHLKESGESRGSSGDDGSVSPAVAIFLTSILEFIGELALTVAGEAAYKRLTNERPRNEKRKSAALRRVVVEETDMEKVAFNTTLGRLWRSWRTLLRSPKTSFSKSMAYDPVNLAGLRNGLGNSASRKRSLSAADGHSLMSESREENSVDEAVEAPEPETIPLPSTDHDVAEIEVPGYSPMAVRRVGNLSDKAFNNRPYSTVIAPQSSVGPFTPDSSRPHTPISTHRWVDDEILSSRHHRSSSLPTPIQTPFVLAPEYPTPVPDASSPAKHPDVAVIPEDPTQPSHGLVLRDQPEGISQNSQTLIERPTGKSNSAPTTPFQGSVLNAISRHAARELEAPSSATSEGSNAKLDAFEEEKINDSQNLSVASAEMPRDPRQMQFHPSPQVQTFPIGDVSPMVGEFSQSGPMTTESGDVSPIESSPETHAFPSEQVNFSTDTVGRYEHYAYPAQVYRAPLPSYQQKFGHHPEYPPLRSVQARQRRMDGPTDEDIAKDDKREAYVVFDEVPSSRSSGASSLSGKDLQLDGTITSKKIRTPGSENGVSPSTPLRGMLEVARNNSSGGSNSTPGQADRSQIHRGARSAPQSSSIQVHARAPSSGSKHSDLRLQLPAVHTGQGVDRAAVQRVSPSPTSIREPSTPQGRQSDSSNRDIRSNYASASSASPSSSHKLKGLMGRQYGEDVRPLVQTRTSSDGTHSVPDEKHMIMIDDSKNKHTSFERLIKSDETIQYTLTPQNMREIEVRQDILQVVNGVADSRQAQDSPRWSSYKRSDTPESRDFPTANESTLVPDQPNPGQSAVPSTKNSNGFRFNPTSTIPRSTSDVATVTMAPKSSFPTKSGPVETRGSIQAVARDPKVEKGTTRDFADFIRSTGPEQVGKSLPSIPPSSPTTGSRSGIAANGPLRSPGPVQPTSPRTLTKSAVGLSSLPRKLSETKAPKKPVQRLQARDAQINRSDESSELIDFIRQGPTLDGVHRIPRTVAPFRTTMDSDEIQDLGDGRSKDARSVTSAQDDSLLTKSLHSSVNSRTGLLDSSSKINANFGTSSSFEKPTRPKEPPHPMRKQRRVKDPYAVDSDTDEGDETMHSSQPHMREESLIDFLNSGPPPSIVPSAFDNMPSASGKTLQRKVSAPSMRARFTGSGLASVGVKSSGLRSPQSTALSPNHYESAGIRNAVATQPREISPRHNPPINSRVAKPKSSQPTFADRQRFEPRRAGAKPIQARIEGAQEIDSMRELADFLKNTEPPEQTQTYMPSATKEESSGFSRMFSRKKKTANTA